MKLHRVLITALLLAASVAFAAGNNGNNGNHNGNNGKNNENSENSGNNGNNGNNGNHNGNNNGNNGNNGNHNGNNNGNNGNNGNHNGNNNGNNGNHNGNSATAANVQDFLSLEKAEGTKSMYVTVFRMNNGWKYNLNGYSEVAVEGSDETVKTKTFSASLGRDEDHVVTKSGKAAKAYAAGLEGIPADVKAGLEQHAIGIYQFEVIVPDDVVEITLSGGKGKGNFTESIYDAATNGNDFYTIGGDESDGVLYFGKSNWIGSYNNGAIFLIGGEKIDPFGQPLPAPVVTLLIALGFGAALVMYRNRKQVKA